MNTLDKIINIWDKFDSKSMDIDKNKSVFIESKLYSFINKGIEEDTEFNIENNKFINKSNNIIEKKKLETLQSPKDKEKEFYLSCN